MVSAIVAILAFSVGLLAFLLPALLGDALSMDARARVGRFYLDLARRSYGHMAFVRRQLGGVEIKSMSMHAERPTAEVELTGGLISDSRTIEFTDPDNRMQRWGKKRTAVIHESVPAVVDPELAEMAYWLQEKKQNDGLIKQPATADQRGRVDPYVPMDDRARISDPKDVPKLESKNVDSDDIQYTETMTARRFSEYKDSLGAVEAASTLVGFGAGIGGVMGMQYIQQEVISDGGGGGNVSDPGPTVPIVVDTVDVLGSIPMDIIALVI